MKVFWKLKCLLPRRREALEQDIREELEALVDLSESEGTRSDLGNVTIAAEDGRSVSTWVLIDQLSADFRYAWRKMRRNPGFTLAAVLSLALGIGANTAIFSLIDAIMLKTLPVKDPATLVVLTSYSRDDRVGAFGYLDYLALRNDQRAFSGIMASSTLAPISRESAPKRRRHSGRSYRATISRSSGYRQLLGAGSGKETRISKSLSSATDGGGSSTAVTPT